MKVSVKKVDALRREWKFEIPRDRVSKKMDEVFGEIGKVAKIKGFRPGKAPRHLVEAHHGKMAQEEVLKKLIPEVYQEGIEKEKISPLDLPDIQDVEFKDGTITFTAQIDIKPEVTVKDYKKIPVKRQSSQVTDEEITKVLEHFQKEHGQDKAAPIDDAFARGLGYPSLEEFKKVLTRQMELDKDRRSRIDVENQIVEALFKNSKLTVPASLVKKQTAQRYEETVRRLKSQGMPEAEIKKRDEEILKDLEKAAERDIRAYLVFDKIAELETITVKDGESLPLKVMEFLLKEAKWEDATTK